MRSMQWQLGMLGTISAFAYRHRETKKNLCRGGRSQDLPPAQPLTGSWKLHLVYRKHLFDTTCTVPSEVGSVELKDVVQNSTNKLQTAMFVKG